jgi:hypothetical protein
MSTREQLAISARVKLEAGLDSISQAELSALQAENVDVNKVLVEEGVAIIPIEQDTVQEVEQEDNMEDNEEVVEE